MKKIRIKNVRSLKDTGLIDMKLINVLVGNNSSGKSTFLRIFPLFKQSFSRRINGPILWVGDDGNDVDFGSFEETRSKCEKNGDIELEFLINFNVDAAIQVGGDNRYFFSMDEYNIKKDAKIKICINNKDGNDCISEFSLKCEKDSLCINNLEKKVYFNGENIEKFDRSNDKKDNIFERYNSNTNYFFSMIKQNLLVETIVKSLTEKVFEKNIIGDYIPNILLEDFLYKLAIDTFIKNEMNILECREKYKESMKRTGLDDIFNKINISEKILMTEENFKNLKIIFMSVLANYTILYMKKYFLNVNYIKPVRAHAERYYRLRNLSVDEIDSDGRNLPMFINSLSNKALLNYNKWLFENFGFKVEKKSSSGHVSLNVEVNNSSINLSDTGYGYSQLLPIITQLWVLTEYRGMRDWEGIPIVFAIEQLELHLHPCLQAKLIDVIIKIAKKYEGKIQFLLETHSETVINRLGNLIYKEKLSEKDVNIIVFNKEIYDCNTKIKISGFDKEGYLRNWPIGFFSVDDIK